MIKRKTKTILLLLSLLVFVFFYANSFKNQNLTSPIVKDSLFPPQEEISQASLPPFYELTIPYLRSRSYESELGQLEKVSEHNLYISYLTFYSSDGLKINGLLTVPKGKVPESGWPAVVFVHGYIPPSQYETRQNYGSYVDFLASRGLVVFKIDLRGHGQSQGLASGAYYSSDYIIDTLNAYSALKTAVFVDSKKIGLWGHSMAGNVVFRSLVALPEINSVVIWAGAVYTYEDFAKFSISDNSYRPPASDSPAREKRRELFAVYGEFDPQNEFWQQVVPTNYLEGVAARIQLHHANDDQVVDINYSKNLINVLDGTEIDHQLYEYSSGGHNLTGSNFTVAMQTTADFLKQ